MLRIATEPVILGINLDFTIALSPSHIYDDSITGRSHRRKTMTTISSVNLNYVRDIVVYVWCVFIYR